jgi:hypothetical protein
MAELEAIQAAKAGSPMVTVGLAGYSGVKLQNEKFADMLAGAKLQKKEPRVALRNCTEEYEAEKKICMRLPSAKAKSRCLIAASLAYYFCVFKGRSPSQLGQLEKWTTSSAGSAHLK